MISFFIPGLPKPAGSKRGFPIYRGPRAAKVFTGHVAMVDACETSKDWKRAVAIAAKAALPPGFKPLEGPLRVSFVFYMPRPKGHFRTGKNSSLLKADAPVYPMFKPDVLKLARAVEDALTSVAWVDDAQIFSEHLEKFYQANHPFSQTGVQVQIEEL